VIFRAENKSSEEVIYSLYLVKITKSVISFQVRKVDFCCDFGELEIGTKVRNRHCTIIIK
jgi:hypothetical protein